jgi:molybdenum cofactor guanylyltransferase
MLEPSNEPTTEAYVEKPAARQLKSPPIGGYVLAGGRSSRMGTDKALLELAGKPLIEHAVTKLCRVCASAHILSASAALAGYAPLVADLHPGCGPIGGIEAALAHSPYDWNLILPVDLPLLPTAFLDGWARSARAGAARGLRIDHFTVSGVAQPTLLMVHREAAPYIVRAVERGDFKLFAVLEAAGRELAARHGLKLGRVFRSQPWDERGGFGAALGRASGATRQTTTAAQQRSQPLWFANLNTPEDFAEAEAHADALDTGEPV